jgi:hypothetical protein
VLIERVWMLGAQRTLEVDIHTIRLRGGWELVATGSPEGGFMRLTLPALADGLPPGRLRLTRRFNRPPRVVCAAVVLRLSQCPGIHSVVLNGRPFVAASPDRSEFELSHVQLASSNTLIIEAEPPREHAEWGVVSLIFKSGTDEVPPIMG